MVEQRLPRRRPDIDLRRGEDEATVVDEEGRQLGVLDTTATALWELCDGRTTIDEIVTAVCTVWAVEPAVARQDVEAALLKMEGAGLITWAGAEHG